MDSNISEEEVLRQFVKKVSKESGVAVDVDAAVAVISRKIDEEIVDALPESIMDKMIELDERGEATDEKVNSLLDESGVDPMPITKRVMMAFQKAMMERKEA